MQRGAALTLVASMSSALILVFRLGGQFDEVTLSAVFISSSGAGICLQLAGAGLLLASLDDPSAHGSRLINAVIATLSFAFSGHAGALDLTAGLVAFAHASAAAWWIGSLWLLRYACAQSQLPEIIEVVTRFSAIATRLVGALVIAGLLLILILVGFVELPQLTPYEQILVVKLGMAAVVLAVASYNRFRLTPRLAIGDATALASLRRAILAEFIVIGGIVMTTAILTTYTAPHQ
jgi:putative copper export protein